jgi:hypothetical protein
VIVALLAGAVIAAYVVLATLEPDARGLGTHEQLGMAPCGWPARHGMPCPTCGITTSAALVLDLRLLAAFSTQPLGALLTLAGATFAVAGIVHAVRGRSLMARLSWWRWGWIGIGTLVVVLLSWWYVVSSHAGR